MYYWIQAGFEIAGDVKRVASEQLELARSQLAVDTLDPHEAVHEARRALRRLRALLGLFQDELGKGYDALREPYRSCTRALSPLRDAQALLEALARTRRREAAALGRARYEALEARLRGRRDHLLATAAPDRAAMLRVLDRARRQLPLWTPRAGIDLLRDGLVRRYRRGRKALGRAREHHRMEETHALRRRSRELGLDYVLLQSLFPELPRSGIRRAHRIAQLLGRERELLLLRRAVRRLRPKAADRAALARYAESLDASRDRLHAQALKVADKVYADKPRRFAETLEELAAPPPAPQA